MRTWGETGTAHTGPLPVLRDDQVDVGRHLAVQTQRHLVLAQLLQRVLDVDLAAVDVHLVLQAQRGGHVVVGDRAEHLVLGADLEPDHHRLVVDELGQLPGLVALLGLAPGGRLAEPPGLGLGALPRQHRELAREQVVAAVAVGDVLHIAGQADVRDVLGQHDLQSGSLASDSRDSNSGGRSARAASRRRTPSRASVSTSCRSWSKVLSPRSRSARCCSTTGSGQASTNTLTASTPRASPSRSPITGTQAGTYTRL